MTVFLLLAAAIAAIAAVTDTRTGHIPNWLTLGAIGCAPLVHLAAALVGHATLTEALTRAGLSILGALSAVVPLFVFAKGGLGAGDVKLFAALGALCGFSVGLDIVLQSFVFAAVGGTAVAVYRGRFIALVRNVGTTFVNTLRHAERRRPVPAADMVWLRMGPAIFAATAIQVALHWRA